MMPRTLLSTGQKDLKFKVIDVMLILERLDDERCKVHEEPCASIQKHNNPSEPVTNMPRRRKTRGTT